MGNISDVINRVEPKFAEMLIRFKVGIIEASEYVASVKRRSDWASVSKLRGSIE
jgi:hypothetical protein